jgi:heterodisulfide reductase subunit C1
MAVNEGIGVEKLGSFVEIGDYLAENGASKVPEAGIKNMERDLGERWTEFKKNLETIRLELGLSARDIRKNSGEVQSILEGTGYFEREKWIKEKIQENRLHQILKNQYVKKEDESGDLGFENDRGCTGQAALIL